MRNTLTGLILAGVLAYAPATAQDSAPGADLVRSRLSMELPPSWMIADFESSEPVNYGNDVEPRWKRRFTVTLEVAEETYTVDGAEGNVTFVVPALDSGAQKTLHGVSTTTFDAGWSVSFAMENRPLVGTGKPKDVFSGRVIVRGSEAHNKWLEARNDRRLAELKERLEAERRKVHAEQESESQEMRRRHKTELERLEAEHQKTLERIRKEHEQNVTRLKETLKHIPERVKLMEELRKRQADIRQADKQLVGSVEKTVSERQAFADRLAETVAGAGPSAAMKGYLEVLKTGDPLLAVPVFKKMLERGSENLAEDAFAAAFDEVSSARVQDRLLVAVTGPGRTISVNVMKDGQTTGAFELAELEVVSNGTMKGSFAGDWINEENSATPFEAQINGRTISGRNERCEIDGELKPNGGFVGYLDCAGYKRVRVES